MSLLLSIEEVKKELILNHSIARFFKLLTKKKFPSSYWLYKWADEILGIETELDIIPRDKLIQKVGMSIYYLNNFCAELICSFNDKSETSPTARYIRFHINLISSLIKSFFFKEESIEPLNEPYIRYDLTILKTGEDIIMSFINKDIENFENHLLTKFFFYSHLLYAFVTINHERKFGRFLHFKHNKEQFLNQCKHLKDKLSRRESTSFFSEIKNEIKKGEGDIDPFAWYLTAISWKILGILSNPLIYFPSSLEEKLAKTSNKFIEDFKALVLEFYNGSLSIEYLFKRLSELEIRLVTDYLHKTLGDYENVREKVDNLNRRLSEISKVQFKEIFISTETSTKSLGRKIQQILKETGNLKIETIIEKLDKKELEHLIITIKNHIEGFPGLEKSDFVGLYSSGVFLAHLANNIINDNGKFIWLFKTYPYIATLPIHREPVREWERLIIFDETYKTGMTLSLYENYLRRNLCNFYEQSRKKILVFTPLFSIDSEILIIEDIRKTFKIVPIFDFKKEKNYSSGHSQNDKEKLILKIPILEVSAKEFLKKNRDILIEEISDLAEKGKTKIVNLYYLLGNSYFMFWAAHLLAERINKKSSEKNLEEIYLKSSNLESRILCFFIALILKIKFRKNVKFVKEGHATRYPIFRVEFLLKNNNLKQSNRQEEDVVYLYSKEDLEEVLNDKVLS